MTYIKQPLQQLSIYSTNSSLRGLIDYKRAPFSKKPPILDLFLGILFKINEMRPIYVRYIESRTDDLKKKYISS
jgi:hypothetical protein